MGAKKETDQFLFWTFFWSAFKVSWPCERAFLADNGLKECTAIFLAQRTLPHCMYGNGANTLTLRNSGKTLLIQCCETVVKRCLKAQSQHIQQLTTGSFYGTEHRVNNTVFKLRLLAEGMFTLSLPGLCCHEVLCVWNSCCSPGRCWLVASEVMRLLRHRCCKRIHK